MRRANFLQHVVSALCDTSHSNRYTASGIIVVSPAHRGPGFETRLSLIGAKKRRNDFALRRPAV
jgi:hypothetical protein